MSGKKTFVIFHALFLQIGVSLISSKNLLSKICTRYLKQYLVSPCKHYILLILTKSLLQDMYKISFTISCNLSCVFFTRFLCHYTYLVHILYISCTYLVHILLPNSLENNIVRAIYKISPKSNTEKNLCKGKYATS